MSGPQLEKVSESTSFPSLMSQRRLTAIMMSSDHMTAPRGEFHVNLLYCRCCEQCWSHSQCLHPETGNKDCLQILCRQGAPCAIHHLSFKSIWLGLKKCYWDGGIGKNCSIIVHFCTRPLPSTQPQYQILIGSS